jgi:hypothetical protein
MTNKQQSPLKIYHFKNSPSAPTVNARRRDHRYDAFLEELVVEARSHDVVANVGRHRVDLQCIWIDPTVDVLAKIHVEIFKLGRPVAPEMRLDAAADCPSAQVKVGAE